MATSAIPTKRKQQGSRQPNSENLKEKSSAPRRTTVALSPEALEIVQRFQEATGLSLSESISELIERTEPRPPRIKYVDGIPMADIPMDGEWITTEDVLRAQAELG
jgi:hypothetical protein